MDYKTARKYGREGGMIKQYCSTVETKYVIRDIGNVSGTKGFQQGKSKSGKFHPRTSYESLEMK
jgi:hypothetical protein